MDVKRGDVVDFDFGPSQDSRMEGLHPAVIVQTDKLNRLDRYPLTILVAVSSTGIEASPSHVRVAASAQNGLDHASYAKCEQVFTVPKGQVKRVRGSLDAPDVFRVNEALRAALSF